MTDYYGQRTARLESDHLILDYLTQGGPRIVRLIPKVLGENLLAETPDATPSLILPPRTCNPGRLLRSGRPVTVRAPLTTQLLLPRLWPTS